MTKNWKHLNIPSNYISFKNNSIFSHPIFQPESTQLGEEQLCTICGECTLSRRSCLFFSCERQWKASRFSTCEMWRKCDILCFFCLVLIRFWYPFFVSNVAVNNILTEFCLTRRGTATALAPACRCPSCPSCPAVDAVGGERAAAEHGAFGAFEYGAECGTQSELFWRFFKVFFVSESR